MPDYTAQIQQAADQYLTAVAKVQEAFVQTITAFVQQIPKTPEMPAIPGLSAMDVPSPSQISSVSFDFAEKLLAQQRTYTDQVLAAMVPASA